MSDIINKVAGSGLVTIDLAELSDPRPRVIFDIRPHLFMEQILREKDFRTFVKENDWSLYSGKIVGITCSSDAIVPTWAYMLLTLALQPHAAEIFYANQAELEELIFASRISQLDLNTYKDARVVIKGCGDKTIPVNAYVMLAARLKPIVKSIMYGEPCSTVPLYKRPAT